MVSDNGCEFGGRGIGPGACRLTGIGIKFGFVNDCVRLLGKLGIFKLESSLIPIGCVEFPWFIDICSESLWSSFVGGESIGSNFMGSSFIL